MTFLLFKQIIVLFLMMACGYGLVKAKLLAVKDSKTLSVLSIYLIGPFVILKAFQIDFTGDVRDSVMLSTAAAFLINFVLIGIGKVSKWLGGMSGVEEASIVYSNAGNLIIPLVTNMFGDAWVVYASIYMSVQLIFMWTHGLSLVSGVRQFNLQTITKNYNLMAIIIGLVMMLLGLKVPDVMYKALDAISIMIGPVCMIMLGMVFAGANIKKVLLNKRVYIVSFWAMILGPLIILGVLKVSGLINWVPEGHTLLYISFLATMTPAATTITNMAQVYSNTEEEAGAINIMTTIFSMATMPLMTWIYMLVM